LGFGDVVLTGFGTVFVELEFTFFAGFTGVVVFTCALIKGAVTVMEAGALTVVFFVLAATTIGKDHFKSPVSALSKLPL